jgi:hypothetical protein
MGGTRHCSLWVGAIFTLLSACGNETSDMASGASGAADASTDDSMSADGRTTGNVPAGGASGGSDDSSDGTTKPGDKKKDPNKKDEPLSDETEFFSADTSGGSFANGGASRSAGAPAPAGSTPTTAATPPAMGPSNGESSATDASAAVVTSVQRGDIYRVLPDKRILNLNSYRGVQVLDVSDLNNPRVEGRIAVAGDPVEMYVVGDRAFVLLNGWNGYYGSRDDLEIRAASGGLVMSVDIADRANPKLIDQSEVKGRILTSRLTQGSDGQAALFVAATDYDYVTGQPRSLVKSFEVSTGELVAQNELDLGGYVQDVQATTGLMLVASVDYTKMEQRSSVTVIDISSTDGTMVQGATVAAQGVVQNKFNMDAYNGVLRVVSGSSWGSSTQNRLETFSLADLQNIEPIDSCQLTPRDASGAPEQLYATIFMENKGFFVTYFRQDPFHAFSIDDDGTCEEHTQFIVAGWNDFLRPTLDNTRLIGIGHNDTNNARLLSASLYDAVNLDNPEPLLARADIELNGAYSEANWDDRAFSVIENAVSVQAADGTEETGLVLLPFSGWDNPNQTQIAKVQLFTFSNSTLTKRGELDHGSPVRRAFQVDSDTTGNLSEDVLSLFDTANPDQPEELGRVDVAPSYSRVFTFGDHVARLRDSTNYYYVGQGARRPNSKVQVISAAGDLDQNPVLASFDVPAGANLLQVGNLLVSVLTETTYDQTGQNPKSLSKIQVWDLKDPSKPVKAGSLETDRLHGSYASGVYPTSWVTRPGVSGGSSACFNCGPGGPQATGYVVDKSIVFASTEQQQESLGFVTQCDTYPVGRSCLPNDKGEYVCDNPYFSGGISCVTPDDGEETCTGQFFKCDDEKGECEPAEEPEFTNRNCNHYEQVRSWQSFAFDALDLRDANAPTLAKRIELPTDEEGTSVIAANNTLYFNFQQPAQKPGDKRPYVKRFVRLLGFSNPAKPSVGEPVNIPGDVIAADGTTLYTRDFVWKDSDARTMVARLVVEDGKAHLQASEVFEDREVSAVKLDGAGHVLVSSDPVYNPGVSVPVSPRPTAAPRTSAPRAASTPSAALEQPKSKLSILDDQDLSLVGEADVDSWARFQDAEGGLALYAVSGGLLVIDVRDAAKPKAQAYFAVNGWPNEFVFDGKSILFAANMYGIYRFDADVFNLLMP